jgi:hypothetical protein
LPGARREIITVGAVDGNAEFKAAVSDWQVAIDPAGTVGIRKLRVRLIGTKVNEDKLELTELKLEDEREESLLFTENPRTALLTWDGPQKAIYAEVVFDPTPPAEVEFVKLPTKAAAGAKIALAVKTAERTKNQAPIGKVQFFVGDPAKAEAVDGTLDPKSKTWQAEILVPEEAKGKVAVTARATTLADVSATVDAVIAVKPADLADSKITGVVKWDTKLQSERNVTLIDTKSKTIIGKTKTDKNGVYLFDKVKPGTYVVLVRYAGMFQGTAQAVVTKEKGEKIEKDITISRLP